MSTGDAEIYAHFKKECSRIWAEGRRGAVTNQERQGNHRLPPGTSTTEKARKNIDQQTNIAAARSKFPSPPLRCGSPSSRRTCEVKEREQKMPGVYFAQTPCCKRCFAHVMGPPSHDSIHHWHSTHTTHKSPPEGAPLCSGYVNYTQWTECTLGGPQECNRLTRICSNHQCKIYSGVFSLLLSRGREGNAREGFGIYPPWNALSLSAHHICK
ncbi:hypothetical protein DFJ77DRAFT_88439 [Powellomyces hirtus]|nr:hypothetical protein DFJ77DRAFT_88439 [Powellomyces hirtus]